MNYTLSPLQLLGIAGGSYLLSLVLGVVVGSAVAVFGTICLLLAGVRAIESSAKRKMHK